MTQPFKVLIIDDHPMIIESYERILGSISSTYSHYTFNIHTACCCDSANKIIDELIDQSIIDLVFLDISLPPSKKGIMTSGEDIGVKLRGIYPNVKIIVATMYNNNYRLINILKSFNPEGLLVKTELGSQDIREAILSILSDTPYYSKSVLKLIRQHVSNDINLDSIDRYLLYQISIGTKTKNLPDYIPLSLSAIEQRKRKLNTAFNTEENSDKTLLKHAKENGFL